MQPALSPQNGEHDEARKTPIARFERPHRLDRGLERIVETALVGDNGCECARGRIARRKARSLALVLLRLGWSQGRDALVGLGSSMC